MQRGQLTRLSAIGALTIAAVAVLLVLISGGSAYVLNAEFYDAGQLVTGDLVTVAGHKVGTVGAVKLAGNGLAEIELDISDSSIAPLRRQTVATIGQLSLTGVANRFVGLSPGAGRPIPSGGTLPASQTRGIVDLDVVLDSLTPRVRSQLQQLLKSGAYVVSGSTSRQINRATQFLNPALSQTSAFGAEVVADRFALERLISSTAQITSALADRDQDLAGAVTNTATALNEVASERSALQDAISRAPAVLEQGGGVLVDVNRTLKAVNPALHDLRPVAPRLATLLRRIEPAVRNAVPTIAGVQALVPGARTALHEFPAVEREATPAVKSLAAALPPITPILSGLRPYIPDAISGFFNGVGGASTGAYDANGHYLKSELTLQGGGNSLSGLLTLLGGVTSSLGPFHGARSGLVAPCPGGGSPRSPDATAPWTAPDTLAATGHLCNPADDQK
ncbi:MAG TPA: MlaD family protein [Solirubrobacteraceae bacterium]|jgi:phospholipid/cholesterol/gamma-HCH transport system substrate-binding protein